MKKSFICLLVLILFSLSNNVFATNWLYIGRDFNTDFYVDSETVSKNGDILIFWDLMIFEQQSGIKKIMSKREAKLSSPRLCMQLAFHAFDSNNREINNTRIINSYEWDTIQVGSIYEKEINIALKNAKEGQDKSGMPIP